MCLARVYVSVVLLLLLLLCYPPTTHTHIHTHTHAVIRTVFEMIQEQGFNVVGYDNKFVCVCVLCSVYTSVCSRRGCGLCLGVQEARERERERVCVCVCVWGAYGVVLHRCRGQGSAWARLPTQHTHTPYTPHSLSPPHQHTPHTPNTLTLTTPHEHTHTHIRTHQQQGDAVSIV